MFIKFLSNKKPLIFKKNYAFAAWNYMYSQCFRSCFVYIISCNMLNVCNVHASVILNWYQAARMLCTAGQCTRHMMWKFDLISLSPIAAVLHFTFHISHETFADEMEGLSVTLDKLVLNMLSPHTQTHSTKSIYHNIQRNVRPLKIDFPSSENSNSTSLNYFQMENIASP